MSKKIGLALSGGGFRASLYHLGLVRFLRDAGILSQVTHITSVSGGSIFAAHLVMNWERYNGTDDEFEVVAADFLAFVRMNVRSRIVRRFPLTMPVRWLRRFLGKSNRWFTRTGLLEYHYEKYLYGDVSLFELPKTPQLHLLTTNLSEGCLCSFNREGLMTVRRLTGQTFRIDRVRAGLVTVPMAVTASSAFPGFFPPLELTGDEIGVGSGEFGKQAYTDGGVYDNLGVRMFRFLDRHVMADEGLSPDDFHDLPAALKALHEAASASTETSLHRLVQVLHEAGGSNEESPLQRLAITLEEVEALAAKPAAKRALGSGIDRLLERLWEVMRHYQFQHEPLFADLKPVDPTAAELLITSRLSGQSLDADGQLWLNRHLLEAAFRQVIGRPCFRRLNSGLDCVIVSDVGRQIQVVQSYAGGLIRTALRASDILMDRVWQLENETFQGTGSFVFARITGVVEPEEDPTALHPEVQRQAASIRTDLDCFSPLEISTLIRHGYCIGRQVCRSRPDLFGTNLPDRAPWDPMLERQTTQSQAKTATTQTTAARGPTDTTSETRELRKSSNRRIWASLFDRRDWTTYVYVPILVPILLLLPYFSVQYYKRMVRLNTLTLSYAQGSPDLTQLGNLLDSGPPDPWQGVEIEESSETTEPDLSGFKILSDTRITDLRAWNPAGAGKIEGTSRIYTYRRLLVVKQPSAMAHPTFSVRLITSGSEARVRFPDQHMQGKVRKTALKGGEKFRGEALFDLERVPAEVPVEITIEVQSPGLFLQGTESFTSMAFGVDVETAELAQWVLIPKGRDYKNLHYIYYKKDHPETASNGAFTTQYLAKDSTVLAFKILSLEPGYEHEISWDYR